MPPADLERLLAERPVSTMEYSGQPGNWSNLAMGEVQDRIMAVHRADAPMLVRALGAALFSAITTPINHEWSDPQNREAARENGRAAFWAAYSKEEI